tara:strand:+ start:476 stop:619 length:144 start_codon:yes stop_codon:yes gene_type:complete
VEILHLILAETLEQEVVEHVLLVELDLVIVVHQVIQEQLALVEQVYV